MIEYLSLILAIPLGLLLLKLTKKEKDIFSKKPYFPVLIWVLAIASAITFSINKTIAIPLAFLFLMVFTWHKA